MLKFVLGVVALTRVGPSTSKLSGWLKTRSTYLSNVSKCVDKVSGESTNLCGSDPAGGVGGKNSMSAGVLLDNSPEVELAAKSPPRKCRNSDTLGFWGVGASGSTITTTNIVLLLESTEEVTKVRSGGIEVSN